LASSTRRFLGLGRAGGMADNFTGLFSSSGIGFSFSVTSDGLLRFFTD